MIKVDFSIYFCVVTKCVSLLGCLEIGVKQVGCSNSMRSEHEKTIRTNRNRPNERIIGPNESPATDRQFSDAYRVRRRTLSFIIQSMPPATTVNRQNPSRLNRMTMPTLDSMNRRQPPSPQSLLQPQPHTKPKLPPPAIVSPSRRKNQKQERRRFSLLLPNITISNANNNGGRGAAAGNHHHSFITRIKKLMLVLIGECVDVSCVCV